MKSLTTNKNITARTVRFVDDAVNEVMDLDKALELATERGLDLVQINDNEVPVVKVLDANKYLYDLKQAQKENDKKQRTGSIQVKEVQFSTETQEHDLGVKLKKADGFIKAAKHVRFVMKIAGRISSNRDLLRSSVEKMETVINRLGTVDFVQPIQVQGTHVVCTVKQK